MKILRSNENLSRIVLVKIILFFSSRSFLKLQYLSHFCMHFAQIFRTCNFLKSYLINTNTYRYQLPVTRYCPFFGLWFPYKGFESAKAKGSNQMNLNTRDFVSLFGFLLFFILRMRVAVKNRYSKSAHFLGIFF